MPRIHPVAAAIVAPVLLGTVMPASAEAQSAFPWPEVDDLAPRPGITDVNDPDYPGLPEALRLFDFENNTVDGPAVTTAAQWWTQRRPQIADMFGHYMHGHAPPPPNNLVANVLETDHDYFGDGTTTKKTVQLKYGPASASPATVSLYLPNHVSGPAPVVVGLNKGGDIEPGGDRADRWHLPNTLARGYAVATASVNDFASDDSGYADALITPYANDGFAGNWKTIAAWGWGLSRMVDYLESDAAIDPARTVVTGFSRRGKAALYAGAFDDRFEMLAPHQTGGGGAHPNRDEWGAFASFRNQFTHWFLDEFNDLKVFPGVNEYDQLPFDQHLLIALAAPRLVYLSEGEAFGANEAGLEAIRAGATPVWDLLGVDPAQHPHLAWDPTASNANHLFTIEHWNGILDYADANLVPEPGSATILAGAAGAFLARRRSRHQRSKA